jgi:hypothetical protein
VLASLAFAVVCIGASMLLRSAWSYRRQHLVFQSVLVSHRVLPVWSTRPVAVAWPLVEVTLGAATLVGAGLALTVGTAVPYGVAAGALSVVFAGLTLYLCLVLIRAGGVPCGCFADEDRVGWWPALRAGLIVVGGVSSVYLGSPDALVQSV